MNINRHNYEEYFILYMDNELNGADRLMVETFVQNNPDLKDELDILLQSKLLPDNNIVFDNKEELLKIADGSVIDLTNYEEWLTLYIDNELNTEHRNQVEVFLVSHPEIQKEFSILQKTKFQPEEIVFPYKESLYRRTEKVRVIQMRWWRVAVAAILLLALSTTVILVLNKKKQPGSGIASNSSNNGIKSETKNTVAINPTKNETTEPKNQNVETENNDPNNSNKVSETKLASIPNHPDKKLPENKNDKKDELTTNNSNDDKPSNNSQEPIANPSIQRKDYGIVSTIESNSSPTNLGGIVTKPHINPSDERPTFANYQDKNPDDLEGGQNKSSRGFFRKAVRFIEKRTGIKPSNDDDRVLIGSLAVKL